MKSINPTTGIQNSIRIFENTVYRITISKTYFEKIIWKIINFTGFNRLIFSALQKAITDKSST